MGDYARTVNHKSLVQNPGGSGAAHSEDIARLHGARFVAASEFERSEKFASALVNNLTGGDTIAAREMYQGTFEYRPQFTLFFAANHKPKMPNTLSGIWRRLQTVPFEHVPKAPDLTLKARLATDQARAGILAWAVEGLRRWRAEGLGDLPGEIEAANEAYKEESDPYSLFLDERVTTVKGSWTSVDRMFRAYEQWCSLTGRQAAQKAGFGSALKDRGFKQVQRQRKGKGHRAWTNVEVEMPVQIQGYE
jgi:putative DNA primase/helicase